MTKNTAIQIYLRVRPSKDTSERLEVDSHYNTATVSGMNTKKPGEYINNTRDVYKFKFNHIFNQETKQKEVFEVLAQDVIDSAFEGYNGTIFAYGQTGSGKTYTMTGSAEKYVDRGVIPRTISYVFDTIKRETGFEFSVKISYMEIYNNKGYDLLSEDHTYKELKDLPKIKPMENREGHFVLKGLSVHRASTEEDALNLLFIGDTNRVICETPMNDASTRSHCIFIIEIERGSPGSEVRTSAKIYLVDLSGSERIRNTGVTGKLMKEAIYINGSLSVLEHCINCLQKKMNAAARGKSGAEHYIPYRHSLMTTVLKDSLGGNSKTRMITTIHSEDWNLNESISTCRFAMRVAMIKNSLLRNERMDPSAIIKRLKRENAELRSEIKHLKGGHAKEFLTEEDKETCKQMVENYIADPNLNNNLIVHDKLMADECFQIMKLIILKLQRSGGGGGGGKETKVNAIPDMTALSKEEKSRYEDQIMKLRMVLQQRENEIMILLNMVDKKGGEGNKGFMQNMSNVNGPILLRKQDEDKEIKFPDEEIVKQGNQKLREEKKSGDIKHYAVNNEGEITHESASKGRHSSMKNSSMMRSQKMERSMKNDSIREEKKVKQPELRKILKEDINVTKEQLMNRQSCFEKFRRSYRKADALSENTMLLKELHAKGKVVAEEVKLLRKNIERSKNRIDDIRKQEALKGMERGGERKITAEEVECQNSISTYKRKYKENMEKLRKTKGEIERVQMVYERSRNQMQKDFEKWLFIMMQEKGASSSNQRERNVENSPKRGNIQHTQPRRQNFIGNVSGKSSYTNNRYKSTNPGTSFHNDSRMEKESAISKITTNNPEVRKEVEKFYKAREQMKRRNLMNL